MIQLLKTAERAGCHGFPNNYVLQRHLFAYQSVPATAITNKMVLEVGCGEGYGMEMLHSEAAFWLAVDKKCPGHINFSGNLDFRKCLLPGLSCISDDSFDTIICFQVIEHIRDDHALLREMKRVLKPGGTLYLTTPNKNMSLTRNPFHVREYTPPQMFALATQHFNSVSIQGIYGNEMVMEYYEANRKSVEQILRFDILDVQYHLPAFLLKGIYSLLNNYNRMLVARKMPDITASIQYNDFLLKQETSQCLDYFVTVRKR